MSKGNKNSIFVEANVRNNTAKFIFIPITVAEELIFLIFFHKFCLLVAKVTNQIKRL